MNHTLVSIIMPAYNVEAYIEQSVNSIRKQTYGNFELLIIDDGSTDRTNSICVQLADEDKRIQIIRQKNAGAGAARNHGLRLAKGQYIMFVDSDDTVHPEMLEILLNQIKNSSVKLVMGDFMESRQPVMDWKKNDEPIVEIWSQKRMMEILCSGGEELRLRLLLTVPWCKLYHRSLLDGLFYPEGSICEDEFMINEIVKRCSEMIYMNLPLYGYLIRQGSVMHVKFDKKRLSGLRAFEERIFVAESLGYQSCEMKMSQVYLKDLIGSFCQAYSEKCSDQEVFDWIKKHFRDNYKKYKKRLNGSSRWKGFVFYLSPYFYIFIKVISGHRIYEKGVDL